MAPVEKRVIVYGYNASPFYQKVLHLLAHYRVPYDVVLTGMMPPRPMLSEDLGITYRRIPLLVLDGQVYVDTASIIRVLDNTFGGMPGHGHRLLDADPVIQQRIVLHWFDRELFRTAAALIPPSMITKEFAVDRAKFQGRDKLGPVDVEDMQANIRSMLCELEAQLQHQGASADPNDPPTSLLASAQVHATPQYVDVGVYFVLDWLQTRLQSVPTLLPNTADPAVLATAPFPRLLAYLARLRTYLDARRAALPKANKLDPHEAAQHIVEQGRAAAQPRPMPAHRDTSTEGMQEPDPLLKADKVRLGDQVTVTPTDTGKVPQHGTLLALTPHQITLAVCTSAKTGQQPIAVHFPRTFFQLARSDKGRHSNL